VSVRWLTSTGAGDDVLEVTAPGMVLTATAAHVRRCVDAGELEAFGSFAGEVEAALHLYRLAHEPALARASEDDARAALARRRAQDSQLAEARQKGWIV
jgi:hypothetical protein